MPVFRDYRTWEESTNSLLPLSVLSKCCMDEMVFRDLEKNLILQVFLNVGHLRE